MAKQDEVTDDDLELLAELGVDTAPEETGGRTPREQRIIAGFEEIERFYTENKRLPQHGECRDIFERLYAVRLDQIRASEECRNVLHGLDPHGLLTEPTNPPVMTATSDEDLLADLGAEVATPPGEDVTQLVHVRPQAERKAAEEIAQRTPCRDFATFRPQFDRIQQQLKSGERLAVRFQDNSKIEVGDWFIIEGQKAYVAESGEVFVQEFGKKDRRLRVIYDNGTESNLLLRSLQRALYKDEHGRRILANDAKQIPLFANALAEDDALAGTIYVLRSQSDHPYIAAHRELIHKIGVTGQDVSSRIAHAKNDPTFLLAEVEVVATYQLANINRVKVEQLLHKFFESGRLNIELKDRFGQLVDAREWYLVPLKVIDQVIDKIIDGTISQYVYNAAKAEIVLNHPD